MKTNVNTHVKNIHHVTKRTHELFKNSKICNYTNALLLILILSVTILGTQMFLNNQNKAIPEAEIRFTELSKDKKILGTIIPASCQSGIWLTNPDPTIPHNDGQIQANCIMTPSAFISTNPTAVRAGGTYNTSFSSSGATGCRLWVDYPDRNTPGWDGGDNGVEIGTSYNWTGWGAWEKTLLHVACYNAAGWGWDKAASAIVSIIPPPGVNIYFSDPNAIDPSGGGGNGSGDNGDNGGNGRGDN